MDLHNLSLMYGGEYVWAGVSQLDPLSDDARPDLVATVFTVGCQIRFEDPAHADQLAEACRDAAVKLRIAQDEGN